MSATMSWTRLLVNQDVSRNKERFMYCRLNLLLSLTGWSFRTSSTVDQATS